MVCRDAQFNFCPRSTVGGAIDNVAKITRKNEFKRDPSTDALCSHNDDNSDEFEAVLMKL